MFTNTAFASELRVNFWMSCDVAGVTGGKFFGSLQPASATNPSKIALKRTRQDFLHFVMCQPYRITLHTAGRRRLLDNGREILTSQSMRPQWWDLQRPA